MRLEGVSVVRDGTALLDDVTWRVYPGERWALLGPNGSGKTTLLRVVGAGLWPTRGTVEILGERLGRVDMRELRRRISMVSASVARTLRPAQPAGDVVLTGRHAALETWWHEYSDQDRDRAARLLADAGFGGAQFAGRAFGLLSEGERQQVLLARALMAEPELVLLDEPAAGLDLGAREHLLTRLATLSADPAGPAPGAGHPPPGGPPPGDHPRRPAARRPAGGGRTRGRRADRRRRVGGVRCRRGGGAPARPVAGHRPLTPAGPR